MKTRTQIFLPSPTRLGLTFGVSILLLMGLLGLFSLQAGAASQTVYLVNSPADDSNAFDINPGDGICLDNLGGCTLRAALQEANAHPGADTITFNGAFTISINVSSIGALPIITDDLTIDASSVWDAGEDIPGIAIVPGGELVYGTTGLHALGATLNLYGVSVLGWVGGNGVFLQVSNQSIIGGPGPGQRNVLSGNQYGLGISDSLSNTVQGNYLGLRPDGQGVMSNEAGLELFAVGRSQIGGTQPGEGNFITGNTFSGIALYNNSYYNEILSNTIGAMPPGSTGASFPGQYGIYIVGTVIQNNIGALSDQSEAGNLIVAQGVGIYANGAANQLIQWNEIANHIQDGIRLEGGAQNNFISLNQIHDNGQAGIQMDGATAHSNLLNANLITHNTGPGIELVNGAQGGMQPPVITNATTTQAAGTTCAGCYVELFSDPDDEGANFHLQVQADGSGNFVAVYAGTPGSNLTATATDPAAGKGTSEFSAPFPFPLPTTFALYLPLVTR